MVCLDTSFLVDLIRGDQAAIAELKRIEFDENSTLTTTPISACELFAGAYRSKQEEREVQKVNQILRRIKLLDFSLSSCERYGKLTQDLRTAGGPIGDLDALIASIALTNNEPILTQDVVHFGKVPGLIVRTW